MRPAVSVVIATYNKADVLGASIQSVLRQTYLDFEVLVVDDGSTDKTAQVVATFGSRVRYLPKTNGGTGSARNFGIEESRGEYVAFLDGDDLWLPRKLETQMEAFHREPQAIGVQCGAYCVDEALKVFEVRHCDPRQDTLLDFLLFDNLPAFSSTLVTRREWLLQSGGFGTDLVILSDWDMACRIARAGLLRSVPDLLVLYRHYPSNQSRDVGIHIEPGELSLQRFFSNPLCPPDIRRKAHWIWARFYAMLAGGYVRNSQWNEGLRWTMKAIRTSPRVIPYAMGMPVRRIRRRWLTPREISFAGEFPFVVSP